MIYQGHPLDYPMVHVAVSTAPTVSTFYCGLTSDTKQLQEGLRLANEQCERLSAQLQAEKSAVSVDRTINRKERRKRLAELRRRK